MSEELKSCPFCGGEAAFAGEGRAMCAQLMCPFEGSLRIDDWNSRALPPMGNVRSWRFENYGGDHSRIYEGVEAIASVEHHEAQPLCDRHNAEVAALTQALTDLRREVEAERAEVGHLRTESERRRLAIQLLQETADEAAAELAQLRADAKAMAEKLKRDATVIEMLNPDFTALCRKYAPLPAPQQAE